MIYFKQIKPGVRLADRQVNISDTPVTGKGVDATTQNNITIKAIIKRPNLKLHASIFILPRRTMIYRYHARQSSHKKLSSLS
jgi:hypothetical protein